MTTTVIFYSGMTGTLKNKITCNIPHQSRIDSPRALHYIIARENPKRYLQMGFFAHFDLNIYQTN